MRFPTGLVAPSSFVSPCALSSAAQRLCGGRSTLRSAGKGLREVKRWRLCGALLLGVMSAAVGTRVQAQAPTSAPPAQIPAWPASAAAAAKAEADCVAQTDAGQSSTGKAACGLKSLVEFAKSMAEAATRAMSSQAQAIKKQQEEHVEFWSTVSATAKTDKQSGLSDKDRKAQALEEVADKISMDARLALNDAGSSDKAKKRADELVERAQRAIDEARQAREAAKLANRKAALLQEEQPRRDPDSRDNDCPGPQLPTVSRLGGTWLRPTVANDFLVLEYNAAPTSLHTRWYDYREVKQGGSGPKWNTPYSVERNGTFLPVVWSKEKILVHVCGLRFTDIVTVSNSSTGLPEGGADIRGAATVTPVPTLTPALDSLQAVGATGQAATIGGLGFGITPAFASTAVTGYTNGAVTHGASGLSYTDAAITASPEELALEMYATVRNGMQLSASIQKNLAVDTNGSPGQWIRDFQKTPAGTLNHIALEAFVRLVKVNSDATTAPAQSSAAAFDQDMTDTQNLSTDMTNFFGALSGQGYGARAVAIWNNYAVLKGPLDLMREHLKKGNCIPSSEAQETRAAADMAAKTYVEAVIAEKAALKKVNAAPAGTPERAKLQKDYDSKHKATQAAEDKMKAAEVAAADRADSTAPGNKPVNCDDWETKNNQDFLDKYCKKLAWLAAQDSATEDAVKKWHPVTMFKELLMLQGEVESVANSVGYLYSIINNWSEMPVAEQTDFITPVAGNALERISISVQHGYVPFMLANYATGTVPTLTTPAAPTITTAASTSTPAHTVKTVLVEVHRRANLNLIGGAMFFRVPTATYAVQAGLTPATVVNPTPVPVATTNAGGTTYSYTFVFDGNCNGSTGVAGTSVVYQSTNTSPPAVPTAPAYSCVVQTQAGDTQIAGMLGVDWFVTGRDYFPLRNGAGFSKRNLIPALYAATSVTSLGNSSFGVNFEPFSGVDFLVGAGMAHSTLLPAGVTTTTLQPGGYTLPSVTQVRWGLTFGFGLDLNVFSQIFSKGPSSASLP